MFKKNIAFVAHYWIPSVRGGSEIMIHEMAKALAQRGNNVTAFVPLVKSGPKEIDGVRMIYGETAWNQLEKSNTNIVISHHMYYKRAWEYAKRKNVPIVQIVHNDNKETKDYLQYKPSLYVSNTEWVAKSLSLRKYVVVHPPVFPEDHATKRGNKVTLINLIPAKGVDLFYELAKRMKDVQFLGVIGGYGAQVVRKFPNVEIQHHTENMKDDVWSKTGILLVPSSYESYGMVGIEACASGIPVIAHPTPGLKESLGSAGIFIDRNLGTQWETMIRKIMEGGKEYSNKCLEQSKKINSKQELDKFCDAVEKLGEM